jgi:hypothetical protein
VRIAVKHRTIYFVLVFAAGVWILSGQSPVPGARPDPHEIPVPPIATPMRPMPGVNELPDRPAMPDVVTMNNGKKVTTAA